jgi:hypothetical protein
VTQPPGVPVDFDQAARLARALSQNYEAGGGAVDLRAEIEPGVELVGAGEVDWADHFGYMQFERRIDGAEATEADRREVFWAPEATLEGRIPGFGEAAEAHGQPGIAWVERPADPDQNVVDRLLAFVMRLAAVRADNPAVVQQDGATYLGDETLEGGIETERYRLGRSTYWLTKPDGLLVQYEAEVTGLPGTVLVEISDHGPRELVTPSVEQVAPVHVVDEAYRETTGTWPFTS